MNSKNNRKNHDFQILYFLAGSCRTPDGAYSLLCDLREDREIALAGVEASLLRAAAKRVRAERARESEDDAVAFDAEADLADLEAGKALAGRNIEAARAELAFIQRCIEALAPHRRFFHLPAAEAHEAAQREEWRLEFITRAENCLLCEGRIPADQFAAMRQHPDFAASIWPRFCEIRKSLSRDGGGSVLLAERRAFDLPLLLGIIDDVDEIANLGTH